MSPTTITVGTTPVALIPAAVANGGVLSVGLTNSGGEDVRIGDSNVTSASGFLLKAGESIVVDLGTAQAAQPTFPVVHDPDGDVHYGPSGGTQSGVYTVSGRLYAVAASAGGSVDVITAPGPGGVSLPGLNQAAVDLRVRAVGDGIYPSIGKRVGQDAMRATRDIAYRTWDEQLANPGGAVWPRLLIEGHSVVAAGGASSGATAFPALVSNALTDLYGTMTVTIDGHSGFTSTQILALGAPACLAPATPQGCVVLMCLLNDFSSNVPSATSKSNLQSLISAYRTANGAPSPSFVILLEWLRDDVGSTAEPWDNYRAIAQEIADADAGVTILDVGARMGNPATDTLGLFAADRTHPDDAGHALLARLVTAELLHAQAPQPVYPPAAVIDCAQTPTAATTWNTPGPVPLTSGTDAFAYDRESTGAQNASITWQFLAQSGHYDIYLFHRKGSDRGQYDVYLDGVLQGSGASFDGYASSPVNTMTIVNGFHILSSGSHTIKFVMANKNASSSNYKGAIHKVVLTRTGA